MKILSCQTKKLYFINTKNFLDTLLRYFDIKKYNKNWIICKFILLRFISKSNYQLTALANCNFEINSKIHKIQLLQISLLV